MQNESRWLQKVQFALGKAREARQKLSETNGEDLDPLVTLDDGSSIPMDTLDKVIQNRIDHLMESLDQGDYRFGRGR